MSDSSYKWHESVVAEQASIDQHLRDSSRVPDRQRERKGSCEVVPDRTSSIPRLQPPQGMRQPQKIRL